jgi:hypothetical protein
MKTPTEKSENRSKSKLLKDELFVMGHRFFIEKLQGMTNPSIGFCSHYNEFEVFVVDIIKSNSQDEKILVEIIGKINDKLN